MIEPVTKDVWVPAEPAAAFRRFTDELNDWWPREGHSVSGADCAEVRFEGGEGGRLLEVDVDGVEYEWGTLQAWEPPERLVFTWHPGRAPDTAQEVEITFRARDGGTAVRVVHRGWEALGEAGAEQRELYDGGWERVLGRFTASLEASA